MRAALTVGVLLASGCSRAPLQRAPSTPAPSAPIPANVVPESVVETAPPPSDSCPPLAENQVSDDETPSIAGAQERVKAGDWLEARGISRAAFRTWIRTRGLFENYRPYLAEPTARVADALFDVDPSSDQRACVALKVGDKSEDALGCPLVTSTLLRRELAAVLVIRDKQIVSVLEVGYALRMLEFPDRRWLDLQLTFAPGGREADLHDRAKPGAVLVDTAKNRCALPRGGGEPIPLFGCAAALPEMAKFVKETAADPTSPYANELQTDSAFAIKTCAVRGHYTWKAGRFVRSSP